MEEIYNNIINVNEEYITPVAHKWKSVYDYAVEYIKTNCESNYNFLLRNLDEMLKILKVHGNVEEDVVYKTAIYYFLSVNSDFNFNYASESTSVIEGTLILSKDKNLKELFTNEKYRYLGKIKLAYLIAFVSNKTSQENLINYAQIYNDCKAIKTQYKDYCQKNLYDLLVSLI